MNKEIQFFDYERCFLHYSTQILGLRQAKIQGEIIIAKPVFLLTLIDSIEASIFTSNKFVLNDWLEKRYDSLMSLMQKARSLKRKLV